MKTALKYWFTFLLLLLAFSIFLVSCKAKQPLQNTTSENTDKETVTDTEETLTINKAILDQMLFNISQINSSVPECDSLINYYRHELARSITASKHSGDNSYELKYNEALKRLEFLAKIGETQNKTILKNTNTTIRYTVQKTVQIPVEKQMKWYETLFMRIGQICSGLAFIFLTAFFIKTKIT